ncbi:glutamine--fructose-6-phosphate transaminase (isomerizing) [Lachnoclostridium pacaense]|uniref:Glutamine--fructose-6-phosphate aminotransferase [isomerizing] n=1 Tax=Enterocloster hominis (ex Hitch et al. 2024) TaxID=1917870 RepID=A0ABV1D391_9FIRM|nr:glutamine--fructose-6-phosphate transaminase (isomerizing) [Lachnoclostridium pacaense]EEQ58049.1 glutamine-fructose-6-phosphate transaminase (isomerizing) [Clostridiales bacterium 1_7_47FAA]MCC2878096.1 glutamine--fructose-6-phosphate transaminase (isomerizing) [Lachnoclostridium pacaense]
MCGIVGYAGDMQAAPILLDGLARLEYRGYDSAGIAVAGRPEGKEEDGTGTLEVVKAKGRLKVLCEMTDNGRAVAGTCGIGHTRWATHGEPSVANSHPHCAGNKRVAVVHNGIIENFQEIKDKLQKSGVEFISQTDTEVLAHLLDKYYNGNPIETISKMMVRIRGSYALGILFKDRPGEIYAVRKDSPLIAGRSGCGNFIASDVPAILNYTRDICFVKNMEILSITKDGIRLYNIDQDELEPEFSRIDWDTEAAEKNGFEHFMLKEIHEQPKAVRDTLSPRIKDKQIVLDELKMTDEEICGLKRIQMVACGSAYHVCMSAKYIFEQLARIPVDVDLASELRYRNPVFEDHTLAIVVSQSGETADTLAALREARNQGLPVMGIVNVVGSSIAREADYVFYTWAGPEIAVATTKAYSAQLAAVYVLAIYFGRVRGKLDDGTYQGMIEELLLLPDKISRILEEKERIQWFANKFSHNNDVFFIGRGLDYAASMEGSLKLKEISYMHSEAYAAGELKHGTISLIEDGIWTIGIATQGSLFEKLISNMVEVKSRGANILGITSYGNYSMEDTADCTIYVPKTLECFYPSLVVIPLQLLAYYVSLSKGLDVDKPRNLAKSVTVE